MKIECFIDGKRTLLTVNSNKPLNLILMEDIEGTQFNARCRDGNCGNCVVLMNDEAVLSCLVPAFKLRNAHITTFEGYRKTRFWHDLERAYEDTKSQPCPLCFASKTLIFESLLRTIGKNGEQQETDTSHDDETIIKELRLNTCMCLDTREIVEIFNAAANYRRRRRVRRN
jgi:aerobic-type carbon monoxide dehydrogenase small subunit (CoxS/CutS family)